MISFREKDIFGLVYQGISFFYGKIEEESMKYEKYGILFNRKEVFLLSEK